MLVLNPQSDLATSMKLNPTINFDRGLFKNEQTASFHIKAILALMIVAWSFEVQPLSRDTFQCTPVYIAMYPCGEVYMA